MQEKTALHPQALPITTGDNFRELGGYPTQDGRHIKTHKVLRSGLLGNLDAHDLAFLTDYGVRWDVDFRSRDEVERQPDRVPDQATYQYLPVFDYDQTQNSQTIAQLKQRYQNQPDSAHQHMMQVYHNLVADPHAKQTYRQFFATLLSNTNADEAVLFHCTAGKDRTGLGAVLFETALGVAPEVIWQDYLLTNQTAAPHIEKRLAELKAADASEDVLQNIHSLLTVHPDYLKTALKEIKTEAGGIHQFLQQELELSAGDIQDLQKLYLQ
jgi:protein-tyrosine phosphatase